MERIKPIPRLAKLREQAGLTQLEVSQLLGVTETTIANWEKGRSGLEWIERLVKLCKIYSCTPEELLEYVPNLEPQEPETKHRKLEELQRMLGTDRLPPAASTAKNCEKQGIYD